MSKWGQMNLMDPSSPIQTEMLMFHDHTLILLTAIFSFVVFIGVKMLSNNKLSARTMCEAQLLETIWTVIPAFLLIWLALPSLRLLYLIDESNTNNFILKTTGHQWYWSYSSSLKNSFDSFMIHENDLKDGEFRLLEVDNRAFIPQNINSSIICSSSDVLHSWTLPSAGIKIDAVPGRLNSMSTYINFSGVFYGQCSEICGVNHSFMPIVIESFLNSIMKNKKVCGTLNS